MCCEKKCGQCNKCVTRQCGCAIYISSDCVNNVKSVFECSEIETGLSLTETLELLDAFICTKFEEALNYLRIVNVGTGSQLYKGISNIGEKQFRTLRVTSDILTITTPTSTTLTVDIGIDEEALTEAVSTLRCDVSDTLLITKEGNCVRFELPSTVSTPTIYVNSDYVPIYPDTKGDGTLARPFTNTRVYNPDGTVASITPNTAIQNGLDFYSGGSRLSPTNSGYRVVIQNATTAYNHPGDFSYSNINLVIEGTVYQTATSTKVIDMNNTSHFNATNASAIIEISQTGSLRIDGDGFYNNGNTQAATTYATGRTITLKGAGTLLSTQNSPSKYLINADGDSTSNAGAGSNNDGNLCFDISCNVRADLQGILIVGGLSRVDVYKEIRSGLLTNTVNTSLKAIHQTGGQIRFFDGSSVQFNGNTRTDGFTFTPVSPFTPIFIAQSAKIAGVVTNLFTKTTTDPTTIEVTGSPSGYGLGVTNVFASPNLWEVVFKNNILQTGFLDTSVVDVTGGNTFSAINTIGNNVIEVLVIHDSRENARLAGLPRGSAFVNRQTVNAADLVAGVEYRILTAGSPSLGTVGSYITATGSETGTGTAYAYKRDVLLQ